MKNLYLAGKWVPAEDGGTSQTINPFDASPLETLAEATPADVDTAVAAVGHHRAHHAAGQDR